MKMGNLYSKNNIKSMDNNSDATFSTAETTLFDKKIFWLGIFTYLSLAVLSVIFYKERTIFIDVAFRFFSILHEGNYAIQAYRFGSYFTQSFIHISALLELPLKWIMINYSLGFIIYKALAFFICLKWLKNTPLAIVLLLTDVLMVSETFYWIQSELIEGLTFGIFYFAVLQHVASKKIHILRLLLLLGMLITAVFFHPIMIIVIIFITLFLLLDVASTSVYKKYLLGGLPVAAIIFFVKKIYFTTDYDDNASARINNIVDFFPNYLSIPANGEFLRLVMTDFYFLPFFLLGVLGYYIWQKSWLKFGFIFFSFLGYLFLVNVSFPHATFLFHMESFYMPLGLILVLPFAIDIFPKFKKQQALIFLFTIITIRLIHIGFQHQKFTACLDWKRALLKETEHLENKKLFIHSQHIPMEKIMLTWGSPCEFWMLSTVEFDETRSILIYDNKGDLGGEDRKNRQKTVLLRWGHADYQDLPKTYFNFQDTSKYVEYVPKGIELF